MTKDDNDRLKTLERRLAFLQARAYQGGDKDLSYDKEEASALRWAIGIVEIHLKLKRAECQHTWALLQGDEVFCQRCLKRNRIKDAKYCQQSLGGEFSTRADSGFGMPQE